MTYSEPYFPPEQQFYIPGNTADNEYYVYKVWREYHSPNSKDILLSVAIMEQQLQDSGLGSETQYENSAPYYLVAILPGFSDYDYSDIVGGYENLEEIYTYAFTLVGWNQLRD